MQNLTVIVAVFVAAAAIIAVLFWRIKPQATTGLEAAERRATEESEKVRALQAKVAEANARVSVAERNAEQAKEDLRALRSEYNVATDQAATAKADVEHKRMQIDGMSRTIEALDRNLTEDRAKLNRALAEQQSAGDAARQFENISQSLLKGVLEEAKRGVGELAANLQKTSGDELSKHAEKVARTLEPLQTKLSAYDEAVRNFQNRSLESHVSLKEQLSRLQEAERSLHKQAEALTTALSSTPKYKGTYGELALERLMEHAGLQEGPHYEKQARRNTEDGLKIPDMVVKMPGNQKVIVDAKAVMDAYVAAQQTQDDSERNVLLKKHCENVRSRVIDLSAKNYFVDHSDAVELVVLFLPAENLYVAAVENDHGLADFALSRNVIICGPSLLIMLLKSANQLWRRASIEEEAQKIKECGDAIYTAACLFIERYAKLGTKIQQLEEAYNEAAGTLNGNLIPKGRSMGKFAAVASNKEVEDVSLLREDIRPFSSPEAKKLLATTPKLSGLVVGDETAELTFAAGDE
jgi:DNA recombination protein RmuC